MSQSIRQLSEWQTHLDSRLPEPLLSVVQWITGAETFLEASDDTPTEADEHTAKLLTASLEEHMVRRTSCIFGDMRRGYGDCHSYLFICRFLSFYMPPFNSFLLSVVGSNNRL